MEIRLITWCAFLQWLAGVLILSISFLALHFVTYCTLGFATSLNWNQVLAHLYFPGSDNGIYFQERIITMQIFDICHSHHYWKKREFPSEKTNSIKKVKKNPYWSITRPLPKNLLESSKILSIHFFINEIRSIPEKNIIKFWYYTNNFSKITFYFKFETIKLLWEW